MCERGRAHNCRWNYDFVRQPFGLTVCGKSLVVEIKTLKLFVKPQFKVKRRFAWEPF